MNEKKRREEEQFLSNSHAYIQEEKDDNLMILN